MSQRAIGGVVHRAREMGVAVGSVHGEGYYIIETDEELEETIAHIERRARGLRETVELLRIAREKGSW
jgi:biotin operon repressor